MITSLTRQKIVRIVLSMALAVGSAGVLFSGRASLHRATGAQAPAPENIPALIQRGEYLVNEVARCGDCHTPRTANGRLDRTRWLTGAPIWFTPKVRKGEWESRAPDITASGRAGRWSEARMTRFLSSGERSDPPMPAYRLTAEDARAVALYLRSLPGKKK